MKKRTGPILLAPVCRPVKIRSVTRFVLDGLGPCEVITVVQVWRDEDNDGPYHLSNMDLQKEARKFHPSYVTQIARALLEMERVSKVEVVCYFTGDGIEMTKE